MPDCFTLSIQLQTENRYCQCTVSGLDKPGEQRRTAQDGCNGRTLIPSVCMVCPAAALKAKLCLPTPLERECSSSRGSLGITSSGRIPTVGPRGSESFTLTDKAGGSSQRGWYLNWAWEVSQQRERACQGHRSRRVYSLRTASD